MGKILDKPIKVTKDFILKGKGYWPIFNDKNGFTFESNSWLQSANQVFNWSCHYNMQGNHAQFNLSYATQHAKIFCLEHLGTTILL